MTVSPVLIERFNRALLRTESVSAALQNWCGDAIRSIKLDVPAKEATPDQRRRLGIGPDVAIEYRNVQLACRDVVITHAEIWYRPDILTAEMRETLRDTDLPFGIVVRPLRQKRENFAVYELALPFVLEHRAVLVDGGGTPFGIVRERHLADVLKFHDNGAGDARV